MYIKRNSKTVNGKTYTSTLLVEGKRDGKKITHTVLANLSCLSEPALIALENALKGKPNFTLDQVEMTSGRRFGGAFVISKVMERLGITEALGEEKNAPLAQVLIAGRILTQGSRRHIKFWQETQCLEEIFKCGLIEETMLYRCLDWLEMNQEHIENTLFLKKQSTEPVDIVLYDVTSTYLEGEKNELAFYGYNRDKKRGKKQIVLGLLTNASGDPIAIEVFPGNTSDVKTVENQIKKLSERFNLKHVILVGDRGMLKKVPLELIQKKGWDGITCITKPQIKSLIKQDVIQLSLFDQDLYEIESDGFRYILRKNPWRKEELHQQRLSKIEACNLFIQKLNERLNEKPKSTVEAALKKADSKLQRLKLKSFITLKTNGRNIEMVYDRAKLAEVSELDGCYVLKTTLSKTEMSAQSVHTAYKDLGKVESAFRTIKTGLLEIRPLHHRKANRTRACALVAMLSYKVTQYIEKACKKLELPLNSIFDTLETIQTSEIRIKDHQTISHLPINLTAQQCRILKALDIQLPQKFGSNFSC